jgi:hypothetical protein
MTAAGVPGVMQVMNAIRSGSWITLTRVKIYSITLFCMYMALFIVVLCTKKGNLDLTGKPIGTDFSEVWVAGRSALAGHAASAFDPMQHELAQQLAFGVHGFFYGWHYPPFFLGIAALVATMPYLVALVVWQGTTLAFYATTVSRIIPGSLALAAALGFPGVYVNLGHGQNGFLTAGLMGSAILALPRREFLAGALFALLAYKPQFALAVPIALLAGGYWRAIFSAAITVIVMVALTIAAFGINIWLSFYQSLSFTRDVVLQKGDTGWQKIVSVFSAARMWGGSIETAYVAQGLASIAALAILFWLWRRRVDLRLRGAALITASLLTTPYCLDYDLMLLGPAIALVVSFAMEKGFLPWQKSALALVWLAPMFARLAALYLLLPLGLAAVAGLFALTVTIAVQENRAMANAA